MNWEIGTFKKEYENLKLQIEEYQDFWEWYENEYGKTKADLFDEWKASEDKPQSKDGKLPIPQGGETVCDKCNKPALYHLCGEHLIQTFEHERK